MFTAKDASVIASKIYAEKILTEKHLYMSALESRIKISAENGVFKCNLNIENEQTNYPQISKYIEDVVRELGNEPYLFKVLLFRANNAANGAITHFEVNWSKV